MHDEPSDICTARLSFNFVITIYTVGQSFYLEHERRVEHVLRCQIETFIQILVSELSEQLNVVQAIRDGGYFLQANI